MGPNVRRMGRIWAEPDGEQRTYGLARPSLWVRLPSDDESERRVFFFSFCEDRISTMDNISFNGSIPAPINPQSNPKKVRVSKQQENANAIAAIQQQLQNLPAMLAQLMQGQAQPIPQQPQAQVVQENPVADIGQWAINQMQQPKTIALDVPAALTADIAAPKPTLPQELQAPQGIPQAIPQQPAGPAYSRSESGVQVTPGRGNCPCCNQRYRKGVVIDLSKTYIRDAATNKAVPMGRGEEHIPNGLTKSWLRAHATTAFCMLNKTTGKLTWMTGTDILAKLEQKQGKGKEYSAPGFMCGEKYSDHPEMDWPNYQAPGRRESDDELVSNTLLRMVNHLRSNGFQVGRI
jgi:hypothetical protein